MRQYAWFSQIGSHMVCIYGTAQFKLDRTRVQHGLDTTRFSFRTCASMFAREIDALKPTVQSSCVCTRCVHDSLQAHAKFGYVHANCKPRTAE